MKVRVRVSVRVRQSPERLLVELLGDDRVVLVLQPWYGFGFGLGFG